MSEPSPMWPQDQPPMNIYQYWEQKAYDNVQEWDPQDVETLLLAMQEELGEITQAHLEAVHENGDSERVGQELDDLVALCIQLRWRVNQHD